MEQDVKEEVWRLYFEETYSYRELEEHFKGKYKYSQLRSMIDKKYKEMK